MKEEICNLKIKSYNEKQSPTTENKVLQAKGTFMEIHPCLFLFNFLLLNFSFYWGYYEKILGICYYIGKRKHYFKPSKLDGMNLVQVVTLTFTDK